MADSFISALLRVLCIILEADGCVVSDLFFRNGRRHRRADDKGDCKRKPNPKQRKATNVARICHDDCKDALNMLRAHGNQQQFDANLEVDIEGYFAMMELAENPEGVDINVEFNMEELM
jgi:hypothetical protein